MECLPGYIRDFPGQSCTTAKLFFCGLFYFLTVFDLVYEDLGRFEARNKMFIYHESSIARNVSGDFLFPLLVDEASKAPYVNVVSIGHRVLDHAEKRLHRCRHISLVDTCPFSDFVYDVCLSHLLYI